MRVRRTSQLLIGLALVSLLVPSVILAQSIVTGGVSGVVTDNTGAVVEGAQITLSASVWKPLLTICKGA